MFGKISMWYSKVSYKAEAVPIDFFAEAPPIVFKILVLVMLLSAFKHFYFRIINGVPIISALSGGIIQASQIFLLFILGFFIMLGKTIPEGSIPSSVTSYKATFTMPPALFDFIASLSSTLSPQAMKFLPTKEMYLTDMTSWGIVIFFFGMCLTRIFAIIFRSDTYLFEEPLEDMRKIYNKHLYELPKEIKNDFWLSIQKCALANKIPNFVGIGTEVFAKYPNHVPVEQAHNLENMIRQIERADNCGKAKLSEIKRVKEKWSSFWFNFYIHEIHAHANKQGSKLENF